MNHAENRTYFDTVFGVTTMKGWEVGSAESRTLVDLPANWNPPNE
jgi:hypothetical protein